mgnify:CR=1 FL=1
MIVDENKDDLGIFRYLIIFFFFSVGLGIENKYINISGNFGFGDLGIFLISIYLILYQRKHSSLDLYIFIPFVFGFISLISLLNLLNQGFDLHPSVIGYVGRWFYYSLLLFVLSKFFINIHNIWTSIIYITLGFLTQTLIVWVNWFYNGVSFMGIPTLAFIEEYNANTIGFYSSIAFALTLSFLYFPIKYYKNIFRILVIFLLVLFFITGFLSISKGAWACILISCATFFLLRFKINFYSVSFSLLLVFLITLVSYINSDYYGLLEIIDARLNSSGGSNAQRADMFFSTFRMMGDYLWFGAGPKSYELYGFYYVDGGHMSTDPHTAIGGLFAELGIFAGFYFLFIICILLPLYLFHLYRNASNENKPILGSLICLWIILFLFSFLSGLSVSDKLLWLLLAIIYGFKRHITGEKNVI